MSLFYTDVVGRRPNPEFLFILEHVLKEKTSLPTFGICVTNTAVPVLYPFVKPDVHHVISDRIINTGTRIIRLDFDFQSRRYPPPPQAAWVSYALDAQIWIFALKIKWMENSGRGDIHKVQWNEVRLVRLARRLDCFYLIRGAHTYICSCWQHSI